MNTKLNLMTTALALAGRGMPRADDLAEKGREIFKNNQHAVVTVQVVLKRLSGGRSSNPSEIQAGPHRHGYRSHRA